MKWIMEWEDSEGKLWRSVPYNTKDSSELALLCASPLLIVTGCKNLRIVPKLEVVKTYENNPS